jgi:hypothetical protein
MGRESRGRTNAKIALAILSVRYLSKKETG